jgi:hypothetical protein
MSDRAEPVLAAALERLTQDGTLTREQAAAVRTGFHLDLQAQAEPSDERSWTPVLAEVGGYVGAAFVVGAVFALVGDGWDQFSQSVRVGILGGPGLLLLLAAVAIAVNLSGWTLRLRRPEPAGTTSTGDDRRPAILHRLIGTLVLAGGGLLGAAVAAGVGDAYDRWIPVVPLLVWASGYLLVRGVPLHLGTASALVWTVFWVIDLSDVDTFPVSGVVLALTAAIWAALAVYQVVEERALGFAVAGVMAFIGGESAAFSSYAEVGYLLLGLLALTGLVVYVRSRELSALGVGAVSLAVVVPQVVIDYTEGSLGAAGGLLVSGLSIVAVSALATRLRHTDSGPAQLV